MAEFNVQRIKLALTYDATYLANRIIYCKWDNVSSYTKVLLYESDDTTLVGEQTTGPSFIDTEENDILDYGYKFCNSTTLNYFTKNLSQFPYVLRHEQLDSNECVIRVCDLNIDPSVSVTDASSATTADGEIQVTATSSADWIQYRINATDRPRGDGIFSNLLPGTYRIRATDSYGCYDEIDVTVGVLLSSYAVKYRIEYDSMLDERSSHVSRIDILEDGYVGSVTEVCAGPNPITISWEGNNDKLSTTYPSSAQIQLMSETDYQFIEFANYNERKYRVNFYKDYGSGFELKWVGYIIPEVYEEPIISAPYLVTITCTDGLADLQDKDFPQIKGPMSLIKIIATCLDYTDMKVNINSAVDVWETNHNQAATDDPLAQTYFDVYWLKDYKCSEALQYVLEPFGARIFQSDGEFWIVRNETQTGATFAYRTFNSKGAYQSNSTYSPTINIDAATASDRMAWADKSGKLRLHTSYGQVYIDHTANLINNLFFTGRFDLDDITAGFFDGWTVNIGNGVKYGIEAKGVDTDAENTGALYVDFSNAEVSASATIVSREIDFAFTIQDYIKISFDYLIYSIVGLPYLRFRWQIKADTKYLKQDGTWTSTETWIPEYCTSLNTKQKVELVAKLSIGLPIDKLQFKIQPYGNHPYDASSLTGLQGIPTASGAMETGARRIALDTIGGVNVLRYYQLEAGDDATSSPTVLQPDDYAGGGGGNQRVWKQTEVLSWDTGLVNQALSYIFDNVKVEYLINNQEPPDEFAYDTSITVKNKLILEREINLGDLPGIDNAIHLYKHYLELSDGTPTSEWARDGYDELLPILRILSKDNANQHKRGIKILSGTLVGADDIQMINSLIDKWQSDNNYMITNLSWDDINGKFTTTAIQVATDGDSGFTTGFSLGFRA